MHRPLPVRVVLALLGVVASSTACPGRTDPSPSPTAASSPAAAPSPSPSAAADPVPAADPAPAAAGASPCNMVALREASARISERWTSWSPRLGTPPDLTLEAVAAVWAHCPTLPDEAKIMLDSAVDHLAVPSLADVAAAEGRPAPAVNDDPLDARLPGHARYHEIDDAARRAAWEWRGSICPDHAALFEELGRTAAADREAMLWDRCLHRFGFVTREQYVAATRETGLVGFALHHWLTEAGADEATADALARPVVLGGRWLIRPRDGLLLPAAEVPTKLHDVDMLVELRPNAIHYDQRKVATIDGTGRIEAELVATEGAAEALVGELYDLMAGDVEKQAMLAGPGGHGGPGLLLLVAHRELPWSTLRAVLATAAAARVQRVGLAVLADDHAAPLRLVIVHDATAGGSPLELGDGTTVQGVVDAVVAHRGPVRLLACSPAVPCAR